MQGKIPSGSILLEKNSCLDLGLFSCILKKLIEEIISKCFLPKDTVFRYRDIKVNIAQYYYPVFSYSSLYFT